MKKNILLLAILINTTQSFAANEILLLGGGGEPYNALDEQGQPVRGTIFDGDLNALSASLGANRNWKLQSHFNGGHPKTDEIMATKFNLQTPNTPFTPSAFENSIAAYEARINAGGPDGLTRGDQLIIQINTHGAMKMSADRNGKVEGTHSISSVDNVVGSYETLGSGTLSLDRLKSLAALAEKKGIKLAILDFSCHSGNSLSLANSNTCVITATGPIHYGYAGESTFSHHFIEQSKPGKNLEEIYLSAREKYQDASFPMISSDVGKMVQDKLYPLLTPYLYYFDAKADKLSPYLQTESLGLEAFCKSAKTFNELGALLEDMQKVSQEMGNNLAVDDIKQLKSTIKEYFDYQQSIRNTFIDYGADKLKISAKFCPTPLKPAPKKKVELPSCKEMRVEEIVATDFDEQIKRDQQHLAEEKNPSDKFYWTKAIEMGMQMKQYKDKIISENPNLNKFKEFIDALPDKEIKTRAMADKAALQSRKLYTTMYGQLNKSNTENTNACKNIKM